MIKKMFVDLHTRLGEEVDRVKGKYTSDKDLLVEFAPKGLVMVVMVKTAVTKIISSLFV